VNFKEIALAITMIFSMCVGFLSLVSKDYEAALCFFYWPVLVMAAPYFDDRPKD
jgi:hypothetical protein